MTEQLAPQHILDTPRKRRARSFLWRWRVNVRRIRENGSMGRPELIATAGNCLRPYFADGDLLMFIRTTLVRDLDLVICQVRYRHFVRRQIEGGAISVRPETIERFAVKQLRIRADGSWWLCSADGAFPLASGGHRILGPVVGWHRRRARWFKRLARVSDMAFDPDMPIQENAA